MSRDWLTSLLPPQSPSPRGVQASHTREHNGAVDTPYSPRKTVSAEGVDLTMPSLGEDHPHPLTPSVSRGNDTVCAKWPLCCCGAQHGVDMRTKLFFFLFFLFLVGSLGTSLPKSPNRRWRDTRNCVPE